MTPEDQDTINDMFVELEMCEIDEEIVTLLEGTDEA
jgi:hypothetical protein